MGSTGSGRFGDYMPTSGGADLCSKPLKGIRLEDVGQLDYYLNNGGVPSVGVQVQVRTTLANGRIVVETISSNEIIGNIPTKYNYLLACMNSGRSYSGSVISSGTSPIPTVVVNLDAI